MSTSKYTKLMVEPYICDDQKKRLQFFKKFNLSNLRNYSFSILRLTLYCVKKSSASSEKLFQECFQILKFPIFKLFIDENI